MGRLLPLAIVAFLLAACGSSTKSSAPPTTTTTKPAVTTAATTTGPPGALQGEAQSAATGDIPDNQVFLLFRNAAAGYAIKYPEGWAQQGTGRAVTFRDKNNIVRIVVSSGKPFTAAEANANGAHVVSGPDSVTIGGRPAYKVVYSTESAPNAVTGKRVTLVVDRYYLWHAGKRAVVDLGTPEGVDNVDAYRLMIESLRWR